MRIAQVAPLYESVPPQYYGGAERVVSYLTEELVRQGHEVTLFASGDSRTASRLVATWPRSLRREADCCDSLARHLIHLEEVFRQADGFDFIHFHVDYLHYPLSRRSGLPHLTTLHGRLDLPDLAPLYAEFREMPVVSISDAQRAPLPWLNWRATVHHGLAFHRGSVPEVVDDGITGFVCGSVAEAAEAVHRAAGLSRHRCRARFEERFSARRMVRDYLAIYQRILERARDGRDPQGPRAVLLGHLVVGR